MIRTPPKTFLFFLMAFLVSGCDFLQKDAYQRFEDFRVGINYYPSGKLWRDFWDHYDRSQIEQDFQRMEKMDLNLVRIFLHHATFADESTKEKAKNDLDHIIATAQKHHLQLIVTSFDWAKPYKFDVGENVQTKHFKYGLADIIEKYAGHPAIFAWDLKNEPDHDFNSDGHDTVTNWLNEATHFVTTRYPRVLTTVGWLNIQENLSVNHLSSFLSFHQFPEQENLQSRIIKFKNLYAEKMILLEEVGYSTFLKEDGADKTLKDKYKSQLLFLSNAIHLSIKHGLMGMLIWSFADHPEGVGPPRPEPEDQFGIITKSGAPKPAAKMLESGIYPNSCGTPGKWEDLSGFCVSASGRNSRIEVRALGWLGFLFPTRDFQLESGIHCFCSNAFAVKASKLFGTNLKIQHQGLISINGSRIIDAGSWEMPTFE